MKLEGRVLEDRVTEILHEFQIPAHIKGYKYLRSAIILSYTDSSLIELVTKKMYPEVAKSYDTTPSRVERAIRHAIEVSWRRMEEKNNKELQEKYGFIYSPYGKPTNSEFIATVVDYLGHEEAEEAKKTAVTLSKGKSTALEQCLGLEEALQSAIMQAVKETLTDYFSAKK